MESVQSKLQQNKVQKPDRLRDNMNNEVSSTSNGTNHIESQNGDPLTNYRRVYKTRKYADNAVSDNEFNSTRSRGRMQARSIYKSMGNINDIKYQDEFEANMNVIQNNTSTIDLNFHRDELKKFDSLQVPIVGYEVMEERARFTIYKLKVEDDKSDHSWLVFRRYTDFVRLYTRIKTGQPNIVLPLPGKRWFRDNFDPIFLEERVRGLQVFVNAVLKSLPNHPLVREFFCLDEPPQVFSYQPEVQAVYGALEDSITSLKMQLSQKDITIMHLQRRLSQLESQVKNCTNCSSTINNNLS